MWHALAETTADIVSGVNVNTIGLGGLAVYMVCYLGPRLLARQAEEIMRHRTESEKSVQAVRDSCHKELQRMSEQHVETVRLLTSSFQTTLEVISTEFLEHVRAIRAELESSK